jgi:DHA2 family multidrug resistance protein
VRRSHRSAIGAGPPPALAVPHGDRMLATMALMVASAMQAADATIANVALPRLEHELGGGVEMGSWVVTAYLCATAVVAPLTGWLRRRFGARVLFAASVSAFAGASLLCSLAPSSGAIILFRVLQGAGGGAIHPLAQAILLDLYPRERHGRMLAIWGATIMLGPILGPALGGIITDLISWRFVFAINLPISALAIWGMGRALPRTRDGSNPPLDLLGIVLLASGVAALQLCLARGVGQSWLRSPELLGEAAITVVACAALAARAKGTRLSVLQPAVFHDLNFATAAFYNFFTSAFLFVVIVFVPALGQGPLGYDATLAGLSIVPRGIVTMLVMLLVGQLIERIDLRILLTAGIMLMTCGFAMLSAARPPHALPWLIAGSTFQAAGGGALITCLSTVGFSTLSSEMRTDAAGVYSLLRQVGCASGVVLMTAVLRAAIQTKLGHPPAGSLENDPALLDIATLQAYSECFRGMALATLVMLPGVWLFRVRPMAPRLGEAA